MRFALVTDRSRALAAGITWTSRTASAPWAGRAGHTSVVDAAGAIYVIGGNGGVGTTFYADVWASTAGNIGVPLYYLLTDGGADRTKSGVVGGYRVGSTGYYEGYYEGTTRGIKVYEGGFRGTRRVV